jgi:hypothetical protein
LAPGWTCCPCARPASHHHQELHPGTDPDRGAAASRLKSR